MRSLHSGKKKHMPTVEMTGVRGFNGAAHKVLQLNGI